MRLRTTLLNNIKVLDFSFYVYILLIIIVMTPLNNYEISLLVNLIFFVLCIPQIILHIKYLYYNIGRVYTINKEAIFIENKNCSKTIKKIDIQSIKLIKPANLDDGWGFHYNGITCYYYLKVSLKSGDIYYFTNLLDPNIDKIFKDNGYSFYRESGIAWI